MLQKVRQPAAQPGYPARLTLYASAPQSLLLNDGLRYISRARANILWALAAQGPPGLTTEALGAATDIRSLYSELCLLRRQLAEWAPLSEWLPCRHSIYILAEPWPSISWEP